MNVTSSLTQSQVVAGPVNDEAKASLNYDSFLKLLVATMRNQDPTKPNDPAETLSQLAAFSTVEQNIKLNTKLDSLLAVSGVGQAAGLIGKTVESLDGSVTGIAKSVETSAEGVTVFLVGGERLLLSSGLRVS
jgi:flagellar basal-body rod modification protein FlgD